MKPKNSMVGLPIRSFFADRAAILVHQLERSAHLNARRGVPAPARGPRTRKFAEGQTDHDQGRHVNSGSGASGASPPSGAWAASGKPIGILDHELDLDRTGLLEPWKRGRDALAELMRRMRRAGQHEVLTSPPKPWRRSGPARWPGHAGHEAAWQHDLAGHAHLVDLDVVSFSAETMATRRLRVCGRGS